MAETFHFDIHPEVVLKLGEELIADEFTAIVEAAKNAYDAGATTIRIRIDTENLPDEKYRSKYANARGTLSVWDDGEGMDAESIQKGWLFIAYSRKKDQKRQALKSQRRVPLGDKGIGRLGLQRIGANVEVFTSSRSGSAYHIAFSWKDFETAEALSSIPVMIETPQQRIRRGTEILVSGLRSPELWRGAAGRDRLQSKLSQMVSPFDELRECNIEVSLNGTTLDLAQFSRRVLSIAEQHIAFNFDAEKLSIRADFALDYFRLAAENYAATAASIASDEGKSLVGFLMSSSGTVAGEMEPGRTSRSCLVTTREVALHGLGEISLESGSPVSPGPFSGELFHFDRRERAAGFERANDFRAFLDSQRGVRIYRNGFAFGRYGVDGADWLGLGESWTGGTSWFGLKPANIVGYIRISAADNPLLEEKTDREGLTDSPAATNFLRLVQEVVRYANLANAFLRRGLVSFDKTLSLASAGETRLDSESVSRRIGRARSAAERVRSSMTDVNVKTPATASDVDELERSISMSQALGTEVDRLKLELSSTMELAGVGLTAEALSHEIAAIADRLYHRTKTVSAHLAKGDHDPRIVEYVEHVRSAVGALRKQIAHLAPALRFARERKERFDVRTFAQDQATFFEERLQQKGMTLKLDLGEEPFGVNTSRGKLTQILDNLIINSEYWLNEQSRRTSKEDAVIRLRLRRPHVLISDTGPGVDQSIEKKLFTPFVTMKPKGRGLGLFIVSQLLDSMGCSISLRPDRNRNGLRYIFDIDLSGVVDGDSQAER